MRPDTANRTFAGLIGAALLTGMVVFCGAVGCVLVVLVVSRVGTDGLDALTSGPHTLWPATVFIAIVGAGAAASARSVVAQIRSSRRLARRVDTLRLAPTGGLVDAARRAGLEGRVALLDSDEQFSFAYGALTPRVVVSRGLVDATSASELDAVLIHEAYHVRNLDPLKVMLARALPAAFFYLPALGGLHRRYVAARELAADRRAVTRCGRRPLAGALFKVVRGPAWPELDMAAAIGGPELLEVRVTQLETGAEPPVARPTVLALGASVLGVLALTALFVASVVSYGGPSAVTDATGAGLGPLDVAGGLLCAVPWAVGIWVGYRWLSHRTRRPLDRDERHVETMRS